MKKLLALGISLLLSGCLQGTTGQLIRVDPALLGDCPASLPQVDGTDDDSLIKREAEVVKQYSQCARDKNALNKIVNELSK